jgi:hypothetical protein
MALRIIDHYPKINDINIARNTRVKLQFNQGVIPQSINYTHFSVNDLSSYTPASGTVGVEYVSGIPNHVVFTPSSYLLANNKYKVYAYGKPNSIVGADNTQLDTTYSYEFTTGTGLIPEEWFVPGIPSGTYSGVIPTEETPVVINDLILNDLEASGFRVTSTYPVNKVTNIATNLSGISIYFNSDIAMTPAQLSGFVSMTITDVLY